MKYLFTIIFISLSAILYGQGEDSQIKLEDLEAPTSPGFALLDISPTSVERPTKPRMVGLNLLNLISSGSALPKNFAMEFAPFWLIKQKEETIYKYLSLKDQNGKHHYFSGVLRKLSVSFTTYYNDSSKNFLPKTNYASYGARTNLLTIWGQNREDQMIGLLKERAGQRQQAIDEGLTDADQIESRLSELRQENSIEVSGIKPLFVLDAAYAFSDTYRDNKIDNRRFNRSAVWLNANLNASLNKNEDYLYFIFHYRHTTDNVLTNTSANSYNRESANDLGLRIGYEKRFFSLSFEYVKRNHELDIFDSRRTVGIIQYKINNNLYLLGSFGRNFGNENNLFSLFGINWFLGDQAIRL